MGRRGLECGVRLLLVIAGSDPHECMELLTLDPLPRHGTRDRRAWRGGWRKRERGSSSRRRRHRRGARHCAISSLLALKWRCVLCACGVCMGMYSYTYRRLNLKFEKAVFADMISCLTLNSFARHLKKLLDSKKSTQKKTYNKLLVWKMWMRCDCTRCIRWRWSHRLNKFSNLLPEPSRPESRSNSWFFGSFPEVSEWGGIFKRRVYVDLWRLVYPIHI